MAEKKRKLPPVARREPHIVTIGNVEDTEIARGNDASKLMNPPITVIDDLYWLRDDSRSNPEVLAHLNEENAYCDSSTAHLMDATLTLFEELKSRLKETDQEVPYKKGPFIYYLRTEIGKSYPIHCRKAISSSSNSNPEETTEEQIICDENDVAQGHEQCDIKQVSVSENHALIAYSVDFSGLEEYEIRVQKLPNALTTGREDLPQEIVKGTDGTFEWDGESRSFYYLTLDDQRRPYRVWRHMVGTNQQDDICILEEMDDRSWIRLLKSTSGDFVFIRSATKMTSEIYAIPLTIRAHQALSSNGLVLQPTAILRKYGDDLLPPSSQEDGQTTTTTIKPPPPPHTSGSIVIDDPPILHLIQPKQEGVLYDIDHHRGTHQGFKELMEPSMQETTGCGGAGSIDGFVVITNRNGAKNFELCYCQCSQSSIEHWKVLLPSSSSLWITGIDVHSQYWVLSCREQGYECVFLALSNDIKNALQTFRYPTTTTTSSSSSSSSSSFECHTNHHLVIRKLPPRDEVYIMSYGTNMEYETDRLRFTYNSPTTPPMTCEYSISAAEDPPRWPSGPSLHAGVGLGSFGSNDVGNIVVLKQKVVPNVDTSVYRTARLLAPSSCGTCEIPISILYRPSALHIKVPSSSSNSSSTVDVGKDVCPLSHPAPLLLYGYGAYGISWDPEFSAAALSLCDRGVVYTIAHIRGGGEMGRSWYEDQGRCLTKKNSFLDFISVADYLIKQQWTQAGKIVAEGGSAGGLVMGVAANERPELWSGVLMQVPFVDAVVTMADPTIPLVSTEWDEWGNPNEHEAYHYIRSYSPMDNIKSQCYPRMLVEAGLSDYRVGYWEPAKFVQRIRAMNLSCSHEIIFKCEMEEGHTGAMDRYKYLRDKAFELSWILDCLNITV